MDSIFFSFDGVTSESMGVYLVKTNDGMFETPFLSEREIISEQVFGNPIPYIYGTKESPHKVTLTFASMNNNFWTFEKRREISRWLSSDKFAEFYVTDDGFLDRRFFLMRESAVPLTTNGLYEGYITITFRNLSPYTYSPINQQIFDFSSITTATHFQFINNGDLELYPPLMEIQKIGAGNISIINLSDGGREFLLDSITDGEILTIDNERRSIDTTLSNTYRTNNFNGNYLKFVYGINQLQITGKCKISLKFRYIFKS